MPCYDGRSVSIDADRLEELRKCEAVLCAILRAVNGAQSYAPMAQLWTLLDHVDWQGAGVSRAWLQAWWQQHQQQDQDKARAEAMEKARGKVRREALAKLTNEERRLLGIKDA